MSGPAEHSRRRRVPARRRTPILLSGFARAQTVDLLAFRTRTGESAHALGERQIEMSTLTPDMRAIIESAHLCFAATVTPDGRPNVSPKGTIRVWDEDHLFFLDIASPRTRANLVCNPYIELNVVDERSRRGYRFFGRGSVHTRDAVFAAGIKRVIAGEGAIYPVTSVVLIEIVRAEAIVSPSYAHLGSEMMMRTAWKERRATLDAEFEKHVSSHPFESTPGSRRK